MTTLDIWYLYDFTLSPPQLTIYFGGMLPNYAQAGEYSVTGISINPDSPDPDNNIYASIEDAFNDNKDFIASLVLEIVNNNLGTLYTVGDFYQVYNAWQMRPDTIQPLDATLTNLSGLSTSSYGRSLLNLSGSTAAKTAIGLTTQDNLPSGSVNAAYTLVEQTKLAGIASGATANSSDATLLNRANHIGTQLSTTISDFTEAAQDAVGAALTADFVYTDASNTIGLRARSFANTASRSLTTSTGAAGFQLSSTRDSMVNYSATISTSVSLSGNSSGVVVLEIAPTNSATAGDWVEIGRTASGQSGTLVIGLTLNQVGGGQIGGVVPAGYFAKLRTINTAGTPTYTYNSGQEVLL